MVTVNKDALIAAAIGVAIVIGVLVWALIRESSDGTPSPQDIQTSIQNCYLIYPEDRDDEPFGVLNVTQRQECIAAAQGN